MSNVWQEPRLWAHYADSHCGISLELVGLDQPPSGIIFDRVEYTTKRPRISVSEMQTMAKNEQVRREVLGRMFFQKGMGWEYEHEYRLVMTTENSTEIRRHLTFPECQYVEFPKLKIKTIYFGLNCKRSDCEMIEGLIEQFLDKKNYPDLKFIEQISNSYDLDATSRNPHYIYF